MKGAGRFAPSPSGELHLGNLRTALLAWLFARSTGRRFLLRIEDLDKARAGAEAEQLRDLSLIGLDWDGPAVRQSERAEHYDAALRRLLDAGIAYECYCTRREIQEAPTAPHAPLGAYPGTCRALNDAERSRRRAERPAALRLRSSTTSGTIDDELHGRYVGVVDDFVLRRNDGVIAYNLAVVVDDAAQGVDQVVRGEDLLSSAPRQAHLARLLGVEPPRYAHVPLMLNQERRRLAKRDGAVTLAALATSGIGPAEVVVWLLGSLGLPGTLPEALRAFRPERLPSEPWVLNTTALTAGTERP